MKPIKLTPLRDASVRSPKDLRQAIIFAGVLVVLTAAVVISLLNYSSKQQSQKPSAPAKVESIPSKPVQQGEIAAEKPGQLSKTSPAVDKLVPKADKAVKPVIPVKIASAPETAMPVESTTTSIPMESALETFIEGQGSLQTDVGPLWDASRHWYRGLGNYYDSVLPPEFRPPPLNAVENQHHKNVFVEIKPYLQTPYSNYSKEKIERINSELAEKLPAKYGPKAQRSFL